MNRHAYFATALLMICGNAFGEMRGIDITVAQAENKKVLVSINSGVGKENQSELSVDEAAKLLKDAKGWGSSIVVSLQVTEVGLDRYLPLLTAISENPWLHLNSINGKQLIEGAPEKKKHSEDVDSYEEVLKLRDPTDPLSEESLLKAAITDERARHFLADLWRRGLLSAKTREQIVTQHLHFHLREEFPHDPIRFPILREVKIIADTDFPFPEEAWVQFSSDIAVGGREPKLNHDDFGNSRSLHKAKGQYFGSLGGSYAGTPDAKAVIQFREIDRDGKQSESAWVIRRELDSIHLEPRK